MSAAWVVLALVACLLAAILLYQWRSNQRLLKERWADARRSHPRLYDQESQR